MGIQALWWGVASGRAVTFIHALSGREAECGCRYGKLATCPDGKMRALFLIGTMFGTKHKATEGGSSEWGLWRGETRHLFGRMGNTQRGS